MLAVLPMIVLSASLPAVSAEEPRRLEVGAKAPDFELPVVGEGRFLQLSDAYEEGPVVVVVLRGFPGYQCSICSSQVGMLMSRAATLREKVAKVILVYPGPADSLERRATDFLAARRLPEPLMMVRDDDLETVTAWGLRWNRPRETAYPATYLIDANGRVRWAKVSESHAGRSSVEEILKAIRKLDG